MPKGIIVVDTPVYCAVCNFRYTEPGEEDLCLIDNDNIEDYAMDELKPPWCPIKPIDEIIERLEKKMALNDKYSASSTDEIFKNNMEYRNMGIEDAIKLLTAVQYE